MNRTMLKSKIHRATVTECDLHYVGSITIDPTLLEVNGAAARLVHRGDTIIVISYGSYDPQDLEHYDPRVVHVTQDNEIRSIDNEVATLLGAPTA